MLDLDREKMIALAFLTGSDYTEGVHGESTIRNRVMTTIRVRVKDKGSVRVRIRDRVRVMVTITIRDRDRIRIELYAIEVNLTEPY